MDKRTATVGQRVRQERTRQGMSVRRLAKLADLSPSMISRVEMGERNLDRRQTLHAVADALGVPVSTLTGQPYEPHTKQEQVLQAAVADIRDALHSTEVGERWDEPTRDLSTLRHELDRAARLSRDSTLAPLAQMVPMLVTDLHAHAADPDGAVRASALPMLVEGLYGAFWIVKVAGAVDLAWHAAERALTAARAAEDPALMGFARALMAQALLRVGQKAGRRAAMVAGRAADELQPHIAPGPVGELYGWSHLTAAWAHTTVGQHDQADDHIAEAVEVAALTGEGTAWDLWFGPNNVALWRMSIAVERGDGGRVDELAGAVHPAALPSRSRRANFYADLGRGLSQEPASWSRAVAQLQRAERLAPVMTRMDPFVRATVEKLRDDEGGEEIQAMARRMGLPAR